MTSQATTLGRARTGGKSYTASGVSYVPGVSGSIGSTVARTLFLPVKSNGMKPTKSRGKAKVQSNTRFANRVNVGLVKTAEGPIQFLLNAVAGFEYIEAALGANAPISTITATAVGPNVTAAGQTTIPVTGSFPQSAPVYVGTGVNQEATEIVSYTAGSLVVNALTINAATNNVVVTMPNVVKLAHSVLASGYDDDMERLAVERCISGKWGYLFPDTEVEKLDLALNSDFCEVTAQAYSTSLYSRLSSGQLTAYEPGTTFEQRALTPYTFQQANIVLPGDPTGGGTPLAATQCVGLKSFKISYDNGLQKFNAAGAPQMTAIPGDNGTCQIDYDVYDTANYPDVWEGFLDGDVPVAMIFGFHKNFGTAASPNWGSCVFKIPYALYDDSAVDEGTDKVTSFQHKAMAQLARGFDQDLLQCYYALPT